MYFSWEHCHETPVSVLVFREIFGVFRERLPFLARSPVVFTSFWPVLLVVKKSDLGSEYKAGNQFDC